MLWLFTKKSFAKRWRQKSVIGIQIDVYESLYNNQINARALIGQSAMVYADKLMEKSRVFWIII